MADASVVVRSHRPHDVTRSTVHVLANTALTGALGSLFWLLAPRFFDDTTVAVSVAASSLLITLGFLAQLNLATALSRFLPGAGAAQRDLVSSSYRAALGASTGAAALVVVVGLARGGSIIEGGDIWLTLALAVSLPVWTVFALQDGALVAVRRTAWLPIENGVTSVAKLLLLPVLGVTAWRAGILAAWTLPIVPAVIIVNRALFARLLQPGDATHPHRRAALRYATADLPGLLLTMVSLRLVPLLVVESQDAPTSAHVAVPWSILAVCALALPAISRLALSEMSHAPSDAPVVLDRLRRMTLTVALPVILVLAAVSPVVLWLAGRSYAAAGAPVLAAGLLGLVPAALVELRFADLRFAGRMARVTMIQSARAAALLVGATVATVSDHVAWLGVVFAAVNALTLLVVEPVAARRLVGVDTLRYLPGISGLVLVLVGVRGVELSRLDELGMADALPFVWYLGVALLLVGAVLSDRAALWAHIVAIVVVLHGLPGMVERHPRFPVAWLHTGFIDQIAENGQLLPRVDARFSWAGFFAGGGFLQRLADSPSLLWAVRFFPVALNLAAVVAIVVIGRYTSATQRQALFAGLLFVCTNWIGQDYFAPQAVNFVLYLTVIAVVLAVFPSDPATTGPRWLTRLLRPERVYPARPPMKLVVGLAFCVLLTVAIVISHQLTPAILAMALLLLVLTGSTRLRAFPILVAALYLGWLSFSAEAYWVGHLDNIFGSVGKVGSLVDQNVRARAGTTGSGRDAVLRSRIALGVVMWIAAGVALVVSRFRSRTPVALLCLFVAPFPMLVVQPYGGEMILRVTLFALPAVSLLIARWAVPPDGLALSTSRRLWWSAALVCVLPLFLLARFGNERFEYVSDADAAVAEDLYAIAPPGSVVYVKNSQTLMYADRVRDLRFRQIGGMSADELVSHLAQRDDTVYVMLSESQAAYGEVSRGYREGWLSVEASELLDTGRFTVESDEGSALLLRFVPEEEGERR